MTDTTTKIPGGLSATGRAAAKAIQKELIASDGETGGCRAFYSPKQWRERGEQYGRNAELIVCHDGGDLALMFSLDHECHETHEKVLQALARVGAWAEACTCWYSAIYKL